MMRDIAKLSPLGGEPSFQQLEAASSPRSILKHINSLSTPEELLSYVDGRYAQLDTINLATVLYRLARLYSFIHVPEQRAAWRKKLMEHPVFTSLLDTIHNNLVQAQAQLVSGDGVSGLNAWCMSNVLWSLVKLEAKEDSSPVYTMAMALAVSSAPLAIHFLKECSGQGLGNLLWSYVQIPGSPPFVKVAILKHMIGILDSTQAHVLDAHALGQGLWCVAQARARSLPVDQDAEWQDAVTRFLLVAAQHAMRLLSSANPHIDITNQQEDDHLLYQAVATMAWSYSIILGSACGIQEPIKTLFLTIMQRVNIRLRLTVTIGQSGRPLPHVLSASFNGQTLSNLVKAYDTANMLTPELLQAVFDTAAVRLSRPTSGPQGLRGFKPSDLLSLLRAGCKGIAQPFSLVQALTRLITQYRNVTSSWSRQELSDVQQALQDVRPYCAVPAPATSPAFISSPAVVINELYPNHMSTFHARTPQPMPRPVSDLSGVSSLAPVSVSTSTSGERLPSSIIVHQVANVGQAAGADGLLRVESSPSALGAVPESGTATVWAAGGNGRPGAVQVAYNPLPGTAYASVGQYVLQQQQMQVPMQVQGAARYGAPGMEPAWSQAMMATPRQQIMNRLWGTNSSSAPASTTNTMAGPMYVTDYNAVRPLAAGPGTQTFYAGDPNAQVVTAPPLMWMVDNQGTLQPVVMPPDLVLQQQAQQQILSSDGTGTLVYYPEPRNN